MQNLCKDKIQLKIELKQELLDFNNFQTDLKLELNNLEIGINQKLQEVTDDKRNQGAWITEAGDRVDELESTNTELRKALLQSIKEQRQSDRFRRKITAKQYSDIQQ